MIAKWARFRAQTLSSVLFFACVTVTLFACAQALADGQPAATTSDVEAPELRLPDLGNAKLDTHSFESSVEGTAFTDSHGNQGGGARLRLRFPWVTGDISGGPEEVTQGGFMLDPGIDLDLLQATADGVVRRRIDVTALALWHGQLTGRDRNLGKELHPELRRRLSVEDQRALLTLLREAEAARVQLLRTVRSGEGFPR